MNPLRVDFDELFELAQAAGTDYKVRKGYAAIIGLYEQIIIRIVEENPHAALYVREALKDHKKALKTGTL